MFSYFTSKKEESDTNTPSAEEESQGLLGSAAAAAAALPGVQAVQEEAEKNPMLTTPNYKSAMIFLAVSAFFFFLALMSLPLIFLRPASFNLYFCFGSMFLQLALAFYYAPLEYCRKLFSAENRFVSVVYVSSLVLSLYMVFSNSGYLMSLITLLIQVTALVWLATVMISGVDSANSWVYALFL